MTSIIKLSTLLLLLALLVSCNGEGCEPTESIPAHIQFTLTDTSGNNLIGTRYNADTIIRLNPELPIEFRSGQQTIRFFYELIESGSDVTLFLSAEESDKFSISYKQEDTDCGTDYEVTEFVYESRQIPLNEENDYFITK